MPAPKAALTSVISSARHVQAMLTSVIVDARLSSEALSSGLSRWSSGDVGDDAP